MKHFGTITRQQRPSTAASLLVKEAQLGVLTSAIGLITGTMSTLLGTAFSSLLSGAVWAQEMSDFVTKTDTHEN